MDYGSGTLFLTTENARWLETSGARELTFHWRSMLMHAVSRDTSSFPHPCIYCQVHTCTHTHKKYSRRDGRLMQLPGQVRKEDVPGAESNGTRGEGAQDEEEDEANGMMPDEEATRDVRYTVEDADMLGVLFQGCLSRPLFLPTAAMCSCVHGVSASLHLSFLGVFACFRWMDGWMGERDLHTVFSECQLLHPDDEEEGEGDFLFNEDEVYGSVCQVLNLACMQLCTDVFARILHLVCDQFMHQHLQIQAMTPSDPRPCTHSRWMSQTWPRCKTAS